MGGVNTLSSTNNILSLRTPSWLWVTGDLLPSLEFLCSLELLLENGVRHNLYVRPLVSQTYVEHTHHKLICRWQRVGLEARWDLLALSVHGGSVVKYQRALMERWPTDLAGNLVLVLARPHDSGKSFLLQGSISSTRI